MASPTASPIPTVESFTHITLHAGAGDGSDFDLVCEGRIPRLWLGTPTAILLDIEDADAASRLVDVLLEAIAYMRHESANAKRCEGRGAA